MRITIVASPGAPHQVQHAQALSSGLAHNGVDSIIVHTHSQAQDAETVACWGWRQGQKHHSAGKRVLVMERGYIGDRFSWTSLGWNGLNNRAAMPIIEDGGNRFRKYHAQHLRHFSRAINAYVLVIGQVPGDAALQNRDLVPWYREMLADCERIYGLPVYFRPHPKAQHGAYPPDLPAAYGDLDVAFTGARAIVTYNSNTAVEAVLAGKSVVALDPGSMAWEVTSHVLGDDYNGDRFDWASKLAWKQWMLSEIEDGSALRYLLRMI